MNRLPRPVCDDNAALQAIAQNNRLASYPRLKRHVGKILAGYAQYIGSLGNATSITQVKIPKVTGRFLKGHYGAPPAALDYITKIREASDSSTCPMCGSLHSGTLDHVMDKDTHPAFAIFSQNLVPACKCNAKRLKPLVGASPGERILHPYFDDVLSERIISARFTDLGPVPRVETRIALDPASPFFAAASFHHNSVVKRTSIHSYLLRRWVKFVQQPRLIIPVLKRDPVDRGELKAIIEEDRDRTDEARDSKNNWDSVFRSGLLDDDVIDWLYRRFSTPGRISNSPLI